MDLWLLAVVVSVSDLTLWIFLSAAIIAILFGTDRGPGWIRRGAYLYSRPHGLFEWFGFGVAVTIALVSQLTMVGLMAFPGNLHDKQIVFASELTLATLWLVRTTLLYRRPRSGPADMRSDPRA